jgi:hypothetical protein
MKKKNIVGLLPLVTILLLSITLQAQVTVNFDNSLDFSQYKTYTFLGWQEDCDKILNDFDKNRLLSAFKSEFDARNLSLVETGGDMAVSLFIFIENLTDLTAYTDYYVGMGYGSAGWGLEGNDESYTTTFNEEDYRMGTMILDIYDLEDKLIFQGISQNMIQEKPAKREKTIPKRVTKLMKSYPVDKVK